MSAQWWLPPLYFDLFPPIPPRTIEPLLVEMPMAFASKGAEQKNAVVEGEQSEIALAARILLPLFLIVTSIATVADETRSWDPGRLAKEDTLEVLTVGPQEGEHWSKVWVVAVDDQLYVRLGRRAAARLEKNTMAPFVRVRIAGHEFANVRAEAAPETADRVAAAMAAKYWSDLLIRLASHPLTVRLSMPVASADPSSGK